MVEKLTGLPPDLIVDKINELVDKVNELVAWANDAAAKANAEAMAEALKVVKLVAACPGELTVDLLVEAAVEGAPPGQQGLAEKMMRKLLLTELFKVDAAGFVGVSEFGKKALG